MQGDLVVAAIKSQKLQPYDKYLRSFEYSRALNAALESKNPVVIYSLLDELYHRRGLEMALSDRNDQDLFPVLNFIQKQINNPRFSNLLIKVAQVILGFYRINF